MTNQCRSYFGVNTSYQIMSHHCHRMQKQDKCEIPLKWVIFSLRFKLSHEVYASASPKLNSLIMPSK